MKKTLKVLVVDDDPRMSKTICDILKIKGYEPTEVHSGEEAAEIVTSETFDCVLMDVKMTGITGIEALKLIKQSTPDLPAILMSAYATDEQKDEAKRIGAYTILGKPVDIQLFLAFLATLQKEKSLLVVDDDPAFCKTVKDILESRGYRVETEIDPEKTMTCIEREYKLAVLLDLKIGHRNGADVLQSIRDKYPTKPVILITGYGKEMAASISRGVKIGAYACLHKPLEIDILIKHIEEIDHRKLQVLLGEKVNF